MAEEAKLSRDTSYEHDSGSISISVRGRLEVLKIASAHHEWRCEVRQNGVVPPFERHRRDWGVVERKIGVIDDGNMDGAESLVGFSEHIDHCLLFGKVCFESLNSCRAVLLQQSVQQRRAVAVVGRDVGSLFYKACSDQSIVQYHVGFRMNSLTEVL